MGSGDRAEREEGLGQAREGGDAPFAAGPGKQTLAERDASTGEEGAPARATSSLAKAAKGPPWAADDSFLRATGMFEQAPAAPAAAPSSAAAPAARSASARPPAARIPATKIAAANSRKLAASVDALRGLDDAALVQRRAEAQARVAEPRLAAAEREQATREHDALELVCAERGLALQADPGETSLVEEKGPMAVRLPERRPEMRAFLERQIAAHGSYQEGRRQITMLLHSELTQGSFAAQQLGREQLAFLDAEVAQFRKAFSIQAMQTARSMLDDGSRAIAAALATYGLPVDTVRLTAAAERARDGEGAGAAADWLTLAHSGENEGRFEDKEGQRQALAAWVDRLQQQQALITRLAHEQDRLLALRAHREHPSHHSGGAGPPRQDLRSGDRRNEGMDEALRAAARSQGQVAKLPPQLVIAPVTLPAEGGSIEERLVTLGSMLREARLGLSSLWIEAERRHPILAAYRNGGSPDPAAAKGLGGGSRASGAGDDAQMRAALQQVMPKLANILRAKSALGSGELSPLTLPPVIELARTQMLVPPGSARAGAVADLVEEASSGGWKAWAIAAITLAATAIALVPTAGASVILATNLSALALDVYVAVESYEEYGLQKSLTNTDLDQARSLSAEEPSLTDLAVKLVSLGLNAAVVTKLFREAVAVRRLAMAGGSDDAARLLDRLGEEHGLSRLGSEISAEAKAASGAGRRAAKGSADSAALSLEGLAQSPRLTWRKNPDGVVRTAEEAVELAKKWGIQIDDDIRFVARDPKILPKDTMAKYFHETFSAGDRLSWDDFLDVRDDLLVTFSRDLLSSDEAIVAVFAHEMHEINNLRAIFDVRETVSAAEMYRLINPGIRGNLHDQAWDVADAAVLRMRVASVGEPPQ